ncbi:MAG: hypothetical protein ACERKZ_16480 [Lachnotalea sp.]
MKKYLSIGLTILIAGALLMTACSSSKSTENTKISEVTETVDSEFVADIPYLEDKSEYHTLDIHGYVPDGE